jgi:CBS domain containing-hemolysin-like protein
MSEWILLAVAVLLMLGCGFFVAAESSLLAVDRPLVEQRAAAGDRSAEGTLQALRTLSTQLSGAQLGITITNLAIGFLAEPALGTLLSGPLGTWGWSDQRVHTVSYVTALTLSSVATMLIGELIPKNIAVARPMGTVGITQLPQRAFTRLMAWPIRALNGTANSVVRLVGVEPQEELRSARQPTELRSLVLRSAAQGALADETADRVVRSIAFGARTAADVQTPRVHVHFLEGSDTVADLIAAVRETGHSRFPVIGSSPDEILGAVHVKDAMAVAPQRRRSVKVADIATSVVSVPDSLELDPLLTLLRAQGLQMAIVVDEYGGTDGVVTLEDLVEEIVGEIDDEHDEAESRSRRQIDGTWSLSGLLRPDEVAEQTRVRLPESDNYETIAGLVHAELGRLAVRGDVVRLELPTEYPGEPLPVTLMVDAMDGRRIDRIILSTGDQA